MKFTHGPELTSSIRAVVEEGNSDLAVAYWGMGAIALLGGKKTPRRVACDLFSGSCNPEAIRALMEAGVAVYDLPRLHAKVYIGETSMVVGSANASVNGLGEEGAEVFDSNEAGYLTDRHEDLNQAREWFEATLIRSSRVDFSALEEVGRLWRLRRQGRLRKTT